MITSGDIPHGLSPSSLYSDSTEYENGGGGRGNTNEEGVTFQTIEYAVEDTEDPDLFTAEHVTFVLLSPIPERRNLPLYVLLLVIAVSLCFALGRICGIGGLGVSDDVVGADR